MSVDSEPLDFTYTTDPADAIVITGIGPVRRQDQAPSITDTLGEANVCTLTGGSPADAARLGVTHLPPVVGANVEVNTLGRRVFAGTVISTAYRYKGGKDKPQWDADLLDFTWQFNRLVPFETYTGVSATTVILDLVATYAPGFTATHVESGLPAITITFDGSLNLGACLDAIGDLLSAPKKWYVDYDLDLHFELMPAVDEVPDDLVDGSLTLQFDPPVRYLEDLSQLRNRVFVRGTDCFGTANDAASQGTYGVIEAPVVSRPEFTTEAECTNYGLAVLAVYAQPIKTLEYVTRDPKTAAGKTVHCALTSPAITGDFLIQVVTIDQLGIASGTFPRFKVSASSVRFTLEDVLRAQTPAPQNITGTASYAVTAGSAATAGTAASVPGTGVSGVTLASGVKNSSLTSVGTLTGLTVTAPIVGSVTGQAASIPLTGLPAHASRHASGGADPVSVLTLSGFPGGTTTFLRADGSFAVPSGGGGSVDAGTLTGTTLAANVVNSSLTSVGTLTALTVAGQFTITGANPIPKVTWTNTANFMQWWFTENATLVALIGAMGSTYTTAIRRNDLELHTVNGGDITFWTGSGTAAQRMKISLAGGLFVGTADTDAGAQNIQAAGSLLGANLLISAANPIPLFTWTSTAQFCQLRFMENAQLVALVGAMGSAFATVDRRNDLELQTVNGGDHTWWTGSGSSTRKAKFSLAGGLYIGTADVDAGAQNLEVAGTTTTVNLSVSGMATAPTASMGTNSMQLATTAFVMSAFTSTAPANHAARHSSGGADALTNLSAAMITLGTLADARLSANVVLEDAANVFTLINPLTMPAESWIGPSATTGVYFKGGFVGFGNTTPANTVAIEGTLAFTRGGGGGIDYMQFERSGTADRILTFYNGSGAAGGGWDFFAGDAGYNASRLRIRNDGTIAITGSLTISTPLAAANGGTGLSTYAVGDLIYASAATPTLAKLAAVAAGSFLRAAGVNTAPAWSTLTIPNTATANCVVYATATNALATGNTNFTFDGNTLTLTGSSNLVIVNTGGNAIQVSKSNNQPAVFKIFGTAGNSQSLSMVGDSLTYTKDDGLTANIAISQAGIVSIPNRIKFGTNSTGAGSAALSTNCPATTPAVPYTWITAQAADGSTVYIPCWK